MQSSNVPSNRRGQIIAACLLGALTMQTAMAGCPPGYRSKAGHCIPGPAQPHRPYVAKSNVHVPAGVSPWHTQPHTLVPKAIDRSKLKRSRVRRSNNTQAPRTSAASFSSVARTRSIRNRCRPAKPR